MMSACWMYTMGCACVVESMIESVMLYPARYPSAPLVTVRFVIEARSRSQISDDI